MTNKNDSSIFKKQLEAKQKGDSGQFQFQLNDTTSEFDSSLMGREGSIKFSEMSKSDGIVGGTLAAYYNLILSCSWGLKELENPTPEETKAFDILSNWFFETNNFEPHLSSILKMLPIGFSVFNKYFTNFNGFMMPVLQERLQKSIWRIDYDGEFVEQITSKSLIVKIPFKDLVFFTFKKEGNDLRGVSLLRQAYYDFKDKQDIKLIAKKGITREMLGLPIGKVPTNVRIDSQEYVQFSELLQMMSSRDYADTDDSLIMPDNYSVEFARTDFNIEDIKSYLSYYDSSIAISVLAQFILLGQQGKGGSYSLGADQSDFFIDGLKYIIDYIEQQFTKELILPTVLSNWTNVDASKFKLQGANLDKKASQEFAGILNTLLTSGIIKAQESDEIQIRKMYGLPEIEKNRPVEKTENSKSFSKKKEIISLWSNGTERTDYINQQVVSLDKYSKASLQIISDKLISSIRWQLNKGNPQGQGLRDVTLNKNAVASYKKNMGQKLSAITKKSWDNAKNKSKKHLEKLAVNPSELPSKVLTSFILNQTDLMIEKQVINLKDTALLVANTATTKGYKIDQVIAEVEKSTDAFIENGNNANLANEVAITQATSYGEMQYYKSIDNNLWGYRFENVSPKTNLCQSLVGKVYHTGSVEMAQMSPPLHYRCKSYYEPIYKDLEKPEYDDYVPPKSVLKEKTM